MHGFVEHVLALFVKGVNERWVCLRVQKSAGHDLVVSSYALSHLSFFFRDKVICHF